MTAGSLGDLPADELENLEAVAENIESRAAYLRERLPEETRDKESAEGLAASIEHEADELLAFLRNELHGGGLEDFEDYEP